jgi:hypothetical protein
LKNSLDMTAAMLLLLACLLFPMMASCGKKGDPVPRQQPVLLMIKNLGGEPVKAGNLLSWTLPDRTKKAKTFKILRSVSIPGEDCPGCPQNFILLTEQDEASLQSGEKEPEKYSYLDRDVIKGHSYGYRIVWCVSSRNCSPESNTAEIKIK